MTVANSQLATPTDLTIGALAGFTAIPAHALSLTLNNDGKNAAGGMRRWLMRPTAAIFSMNTAAAEGFPELTAGKMTTLNANAGICVACHSILIHSSIPFHSIPPPPPPLPDSSLIDRSFRPFHSIHPAKYKLAEVREHHCQLTEHPGTASPCLQQRQHGRTAFITRYFQLGR